MNINGGWKYVTCKNMRKKEGRGDDTWDICIGKQQCNMHEYNKQMNTHDDNEKHERRLKRRSRGVTTAWSKIIRK